MKKSTIDNHGLPTGFYDDGIHGKAIPKEAIEISVKHWQAHISGDLRRWNGSAWEPYTPPFDPAAAAAAQKQAINDACRTAIVGGFESSALGSPRIYDSELEDQINLIGAAGAGIDMDYSCTDPATGIKVSELHTSAQIQQVYADGVIFKAGHLNSARALKEQLDALAAETPTATRTIDQIKADIEAVVWG